MQHREDNVTYQNVGTVTGGLLTDLKPEQRAGALRGAQLLAKALRAAADVLAGKPNPAQDKKLIDFMARTVVELHEMGGEDLPTNDRDWLDLLDEVAGLDDSREWNKIFEKYDEDGLDLKPDVPVIKRAVQKLLK